MEAGRWFKRLIMEIHMTVNGTQVAVEAAPADTLLIILRQKLGLTGAKPGCELGDCGACSVIFNGKLARSCLLKAGQLEGAEVITIEGIHGEDGGPNDLQQAFVEFGATQCGYCTPGMIIAAEVLLRSNPQPSREEIREHLAKNLCRCTGYEQIFEAIEFTADQRNSKEKAHG
jgi:aerobic-type carbon monoxide dehydrogenase small subunit (CoxS/CutS family)